jgi:hypothetical protein
MIVIKNMLIFRCVDLDNNSPEFLGIVNEYTNMDKQTQACIDNYIACNYERIIKPERYGNEIIS